MLEARPITLRAANKLVTDLHRHHKETRGWKFGVAVYESNLLVGAVTVGRPVSREFDPDLVAEVTRLVTSGAHNACSFLYSKAARICKEMGYAKIQTYILADEPGTSLLAAGWELEATTTGGHWDSSERYKNQGRRQDQPQGPKKRYAKYFDDRETMKRKRELILDKSHITSHTGTMQAYKPPRGRRQQVQRAEEGVRKQPQTAGANSNHGTKMIGRSGFGMGRRADLRIEAQVDEDSGNSNGNSRSKTTAAAKTVWPRPDELPVVSVMGKESMKRSVSLMKEYFEQQDLLDAAADADDRCKAIKRELAEIARDNGLPGFRYGTMSALDRGQKTKKTLSAKLLVARGIAMDEIKQCYTTSGAWDDVKLEDQSRPKKKRKRHGGEEELDSSIERSTFA